jgi:hypothetical protein
MTLALVFHLGLLALPIAFGGTFGNRSGTALAAAPCGNGATEPAAAPPPDPPPGTLPGLPSTGGGGCAAENSCPEGGARPVGPAAKSNPSPRDSSGVPVRQLGGLLHPTEKRGARTPPGAPPDAARILGVTVVAIAGPGVARAAPPCDNAAGDPPAAPGPGVPGVPGAPPAPLPPPPPPPPLPVDISAETAALLAALRYPDFGLRMNPAQSVIGLAVWFNATGLTMDAICASRSWDAPYVPTTIAVCARPASFTWDFGDGGRVTTRGLPATPDAVKNTYGWSSDRERGGVFHTALTVRWTLVSSVNGGGWREAGAVTHRATGDLLVEQQQSIVTR